jgi:hypothetical protein
MNVKIFLIFPDRTNKKKIVVNVIRNDEGWIEIGFSYEGDPEHQFSIEVTDTNYQDLVKALSGIESLL